MLRLSRTPAPSRTDCGSMTCWTILANALMRASFGLLAGLESILANKRDIDKMFREKPYLQFIRADHIAHDEIIRPVITHFSGLPRHCSCLIQNDFMGME